MVSPDVSKVVGLILAGNPAFFKFISANETGDTGGHQCGFYVPKDFQTIAFGSPCEKGTNRDLRLKIVWNGTFETDSRLVYYGKGTRNESRITNFGRGFEYLKSEYTGGLVVFVKVDATVYDTYVLNSEEEIDEFLGSLGLGPADANHLIRFDGKSGTPTEEAAFKKYISGLKVDFPSSEEMSAAARQIEDAVYDHSEYVRDKPDAKLLSWTNVEYRLFRTIENDRLGNLVSAGFPCVDDFLQKANQVLNRRKSRAGKSLEHQLAAIFQGNGLFFDEQVVTEGNKKPDFIFPSGKAYHDKTFPDEGLVFLAAKTTCKDRWRQILVEANRFKGKTKYLCTLQQGMSETQMDEMASEDVQLVIPRPYIKDYPLGRQNGILTIEDFVTFVKSTQK